MAEPAAADSAPPPEEAADTAEAEQSNAAPTGEEPPEAASKQEAAVDESGAAVGEAPPDVGEEAPAEGGGEGAREEEEAVVAGAGEAAPAEEASAAAEEGTVAKEDNPDDKDKEQEGAADIAPQEAAADPASPPADAEPAAEAVAAADGAQEEAATDPASPSADAEPTAEAVATADGAQDQEAPAVAAEEAAAPNSTAEPAVAAEEAAAAAPASTAEPEAPADAADEQPAPASAEPEAAEEAGGAFAPDQTQDRADAEGDGDKVPEEATPAVMSGVPEVAPETPEEVKAEADPGDTVTAPDGEKVSGEPVADPVPADAAASGEPGAPAEAEAQEGSNAEAFFSPTSAATGADNAGGAAADENREQPVGTPTAEPAGDSAMPHLSPAPSPSAAAAAAAAELPSQQPQQQSQEPQQQQEPPMLAVDGSVERVEVPDTEMRAEFRGAQAPDPMATAERLKGAVAGVIAEFGSGLMDLPDGELRTALVDWKSKLEYHVLELQDIVQSKLPSPSMAQAAAASEAAAPVEPEPTPIAGGGGIVGLRDFESQLPSFEHGLADPGMPAPPQAVSPSIGAASSAEPFEATRVSDSGLVGDLAHVRNIGRQLESHRTGKDLKEVVSAWEDPDDVAREMADLKRVRRQIRYLFGGMLGTMQEFSPGDAQLRVDDLLGDKGDEPALNIASPAPRQPGDLLGKPPPGILDPRQASPAPARPRSSHTDLSSVSSSNMTWDSQRPPEKGVGGDDSERRKEKKERRHRHHRHRQVSADPEWGRVRQESPSFAGKRDDGAPPKNWNWAEEVMKASLDPENQWDFHNPPRMPADDGNRRSNSTRPPLARGVVPSWEKPRTPGVIRRGDEVASKARERAEELLRNERDRHKQLLAFDQPGAHRNYR